MRNFLCYYFFFFLSFSLHAQIISDSVVFKKATWQFDTVSKNIIWQHYHFNQKQLFSGNENFNIVRVPLRVKALSFDIGSDYDSLAKTSILAQKYDALVAINGSFFDTKKGGAVDFIKTDNHISDTSRIDKNRLAEHQRSGIAVKKNKKLRIIFTPDSTNFNWLNKYAGFESIMVSGPLLLKNFKINSLTKSAFNDNRHPRSCLCLTKKELILLTVDGRTAESYGLNLNELTKIAQWLGCKNAINLDGGGSTTLFIKNQPFNGIVNMPCDGKKFNHETERPVSNIFYIKINAKINN